MGCPVKKILKSGSGVQLMREPDLARSIVREVVKAVGCPVTVKFRLGWSEEEMNYLEMGKVFEEEGAAALVLHARTRVQGFTGLADTNAIGRLVGSVGIPVIGSGDVSDGEGARRLVSETGCAGVMIGRGALGKPWIFDEIRAHITGTESSNSPIFRLDLVQKHLELLLKYLPGRRSVGHLRKHLGWYSKGFPGGAAFRREINWLMEPEEIVQLAGSFLKLDLNP
jgi:tRNA-dihydrouridine synthase B